MLKLQILCRPLALAAFTVAFALALAACGQKGTLFLPTEPAAAQRATLPQVLNPNRTRPTSATTPAPTRVQPNEPPPGSVDPAALAPANPASAPVR